MIYQQDRATKKVLYQIIKLALTTFWEDTKIDKNILTDSDLESGAILDLSLAAM